MNGLIMKDNDIVKQKSKKIIYVFFAIGIIVSVNYAQNVQKEVLPIRGVDRNRIYIEMVQVKGDTFYRGCTPQDGFSCNKNEIGAHRVILNDFYIGKYEVTQELWYAIMKYNNSYFQYAYHYEYSPKTHPVDRVSWDEIQMFLQKLNELTGKKYRLPTEAEWEYAARGGSTQTYFTYSGSYDIDSVCWYWNNARQHTHSIGTKKPNFLGIYDMSGNIMEWCNDWYEEHYYQTDTIMINPQGPQTGIQRVMRGGSWTRLKKIANITYRFPFPPDSAYIDSGFRLALDTWE